MPKFEVLYVEDDDTNIFIMQKFLQDNFKVSVARSGDEACSIFVEKDFDAVLMDINLGTASMDGIEAMSVIRKSNPRNVPIIAVTSYALPGEKKRFIDMGFNGYISKPFDKKTLEEQLLKFIGND